MEAQVLLHVTENVGTLLQHFAYNVSLGVAAWSLGLAAGMVLAVLIVIVRSAEPLVLGFCATFGLLPLLLLPPILSNVGQPHVGIGAWTVYPIEALLIAAACLFPVIEEASAALMVVEPRYRSLARLANLSAVRRLVHLAAPYLFNAILVGACSTLPMAILLAVMFEWSRGGDDGIGVIVQSTIGQGTDLDRLTLVLVVGGVAGAIYVLVDRLRQRFAARFALSHDSGASGGQTAEPRRQIHLEPRLIVGLAIGLGTYLLAWVVLFRLRQLDPAIAITPGDVFQRLWQVAGSPDSVAAQTVLKALSAGLATGAFALFAALVGIGASACAAIAAHKMPRVRTLITMASSVTQAVPIFVLIPFYILIFRSPSLVAVMVTVSVTFFAGYQVFFSRLQAVPSIWQDLMNSTVRHDLRSVMRQLRHWYLPIIVHYGSTALTTVAPSALAAALITDFFLPRKIFLLDNRGLGWMSQFEARTDMFAGLLIVNISLIIIVLLFLLSRSAPIRRYG